MDILNEMMTEHKDLDEAYRRKIGAICKSCGGTLAHVDSDGVETETWVCQSCDTYWSVGITATRHFDEMEIDAEIAQEKSLEARFEADCWMSEEA